MIYTELTRKALKISFEAHKDQTDRSGMPYVYHPYEVASHMDDEYSTCVALLHDVIEDTDITSDSLRNEGFPEEVVQALLCMTRDKSVPYMDYIRKIMTNTIAIKVKVADLTHNSDLSRLNNLTYEDYDRVDKYSKARAMFLAG